MSGLIDRNRWSDVRLARRFGIRSTVVRAERLKRRLPKVLFPTLSPIRKERIWKLFQEGTTYEQIARQLKISHQNVRRFILFALESNGLRETEWQSYQQTLAETAATRAALRKLKPNDPMTPVLRQKLAESLQAENTCLHRLPLHVQKVILGPAKNPKYRKKGRPPSR